MISQILKISVHGRTETGPPRSLQFDIVGLFAQVANADNPGIMKRELLEPAFLQNCLRAASTDFERFTPPNRKPS